LSDLKRRGFFLETISQNGNFSEYGDYVLKNKNNLKAEAKYFKNNLKKGDSWGKIFIVKNQKSEIVASLGPNRIKKDEKGKTRARPGYFSVLPKYRNKKIGTILWKIGIVDMSKMGASYVEISVEKKNLPAFKVYLNSGMKKI